MAKIKSKVTEIPGPNDRIITEEQERAYRHQVQKIQVAIANGIAPEDFKGPISPEWFAYAKDVEKEYAVYKAKNPNAALDLAAD